MGLTRGERASIVEVDLGVRPHWDGIWDGINILGTQPCHFLIVKKKKKTKTLNLLLLFTHL